jgi:hypothetical protein
MAVLASGAVGEFHILEAMDTAAAFKHARMASEAYTPAG